MVRAAVLLLGLVVSCRAGLAPPTVNISLDEDPEVRWAPLLQVFDVEYLKKSGAEIIDATVPKWVHHAVEPIVMALEKYIPPPYAGELRGMASHFGGSLSDVIILNFAYEISAFCTSIIAQDKNGHVYHGRNLDYPHPVLRNLTVNVVFLKNGEVAYRGTSFAGYVGLWTGQSPNKFTVSGDQRGSEHWWNWWKNVVSAFLFKRSPVSWLVRKTLEEAQDFKDAVMSLSKIPIITGVYYVVGGVRAGEGAVITRDRTGPADIWPLDPVNGGWYRVETNFDHWLPPPAWDHRREAANKALNATGQEHINMDTLFQVLSLYPVCNGITVYTTMMSAAAPAKYNTAVRPQGCHTTDWHPAVKNTGF
ncbi:LOW QUALITY PROTEIN: N-acylethanolamine-hydrolyzing acid amidase-like [Mastacembelus armatus]|uniref:LOW QUALITY PROTEIN: N-acylethanolamine-hydrolyzing acid amidase-like n=1 Tax=Mastacembelus armatus TaxID=205130 RepID=UPI000E462C46|nr:LOW QUALITY PROTEIN: N-acylethanolamine-hydrolyzing acid amidase [Mastacembelus armatus]